MRTKGDNDMKLSLAGLVIEISPRYEYTSNLVKDYVTEEGECDFSVNVTDDDIQREAEASEETYSKGYLESIALYRKIAEVIPRYDAIVFHGAVVAYEGRAYAFTARSGVGKTTHLRLWQKLLGDKVTVLNGDKPIIRVINGIPYACGTPWRGKEGYGEAQMLPLSAIGFIERAQLPTVSPMGITEATMRLASQIYVPSSEKEAKAALGVLGKIISGVRFFRIEANMELESAKASYDAFVGDLKSE